MKFPNHVILDISKNFLSTSSQYWLPKYLFFFQKNKLLFNILTSHQKFLLKKETKLLSNLFKDQKSHTLKYNHTNPYFFLSEKVKFFYLSFFKTRFKVKHRSLNSYHLGKEVYDLNKNINCVYDEKYLLLFFKNFKIKHYKSTFKTDKLQQLFNINFLRKEKIYTKLKYSRVPQYDIVSGGVAALFAGFLGFLICEKFGFELADSGDFYFLFMYLVFLFFSLRLFLKIINIGIQDWNFISLKWLICYYRIVFNLFSKFLTCLLNNKIS